MALGKGRASLSHLTEGKPCQVSQLKIFPSFLVRGEVNIRLFYILYGRFCEVFAVFAGVGFAKCMQGGGFAKYLQGVGNLTSAISLYSLS